MTYLVVAGNTIDGLSYVGKDTVEEVADYLRPSIMGFSMGDDVQGVPDVVDVLTIVGTHLQQVGTVTEEFTERMICVECDEEFGYEENEVAHHLTEEGYRDGEDADADHVPHGEAEFTYVRTLVIQPHGDQTALKTITLN